VLGVLTCYAGSAERHEDLLTVLLDGVAAQIGVHVALRRAEGLARQLTRAKDDFIALVGHEMRTPLTSIVANATMLAEEGGALPEDLRAMLEAVLRNSTMLRQVVTTLLDLAGLDSGYLSLTVRRVDLAVIVAEAVEAARGRAGDAVELSVAGSGPFPLDGDAHRLRQAVDDVLANAVKFSLPGGRVRVALAPGDGAVELTVTDDGIGTPDDERDRVFDRFYRGSNVRHQGISGHGLGLSLARTIVQRHGGSIRLTGHRPSGTKVLIRLPVKPQPDTPDIRSDKCDDE
jgi:signal transduction histidine kinase